MKTVLKPAHVVQDQSLAADFSSPAIAVPQADVVALQINYTGAPVGTIRIQASLDHDEDAQGNILNAGSWVDLYFTVNGSLDSTLDLPTYDSPILVDLYGTSFPWIRIDYDFTSGTGNLNAFLTYKRLGS